MLIRFRTKDFPEREAIGLAMQQWTVNQDGKDEVRITVIIPEDLVTPYYCQAEILCEGYHEWLVEGIDKDFSMRRLKENELADVTDQDSEDLYYLWDDGASSQMLRAQRLYKSFQSLIEKNAAKARKIREYAAHERYEKDIAYAKKNGWDGTSIPEPSKGGSYGAIERSSR